VGDGVPGTFAPVDSAGRVSPPSAAASGPTFTLSEPRNQPVSGTSIYFVQYDQPRFRRLFDEILQKTGMSDPTQHANGAVELAYVTVAVSRVEATLEVLKSWGLEPKPAVDDERGARSIEVDLPRGKVFLVEPKTGGGISDFLEERRAKAPPVGNRYFEGVILSVGIGVENLGKTIDWLTDKKIPYNPMRLPNGTVEVVQGAPGWALRLEFVQADQDRDKRWAAHREEGRSASAAGSGADASGSASGEDGSR
jgi:hypothetical protein